MKRQCWYVLGTFVALSLLTCHGVEAADDARMPRPIIVVAQRLQADAPQQDPAPQPEAHGLVRLVSAESHSGGVSVSLQDDPFQDDPFQEDLAPMLEEGPEIEQAITPPDDRMNDVPEPIDAPHALSMFDTPAMPMPFAGTSLWADFCHPQGHCVPCHGAPAWAYFDVLWLQRDEAENYTLATYNGTGGIAMQVDDFSFEYEPGYRFVYGRMVGCTPVEFTYFGTHEWESTMAIDAVDELDSGMSPVTDGAWISADAMSAQYTSELHNAELNLLHCNCSALTLIGGLRYLNVDESFRLASIDATDGNGLLTIDTENHALGLQIGALLEHETCRWRFGLSAKGGVFGNLSESDLFLFDSNYSGLDSVAVSVEQDDEDIGFIGELNLTANYHLCGGISVRGGYQVMWIDGVALAAEQVGNGAAPGAFQAPSIDSDGSVLYDGGFIGLQWIR